jgi:hypothetical protein
VYLLALMTVQAQGNVVNVFNTELG